MSGFFSSPQTIQTQSGGTSSSTFTPNPAVSGLYSWLANQANTLAGQEVPYFPGQTYVGPSDLTQGGVNSMLQGLGVANRNYSQLSNAADVANNPWVQGMLGVNAQNVGQALKEQWLPAANGSAVAVGSGGLGSSRAGLMNAQAVERASQQLNNANQGTLLNAYQQGLGAQQNALAQTGNMLQYQLAPGQVVEGYQQKALADQLARYQYQYDEPWKRMQNIQGLLSFLSPLGVQQGQKYQSGSEPNPNYQSPFQTIAGLGATIYGAGK